MAYAGTPRQASDLRQRVPRIDEKGWRSVRPLRGLERPVLCRFHPLGSGRMRCLLWSVRSNRAPGPHDHPDRAETRLLLFVAVRLAVILAAFNGDASSSHWPRSRYRVSCFAAISFWRRGEELAATSDRGFDRSAERGNAGNTHPSRWLYAVEPAHERLEWRSGTSEISAWHNRAAAARCAGFPGQAMSQLPFPRGEWRTERPGSGRRCGATDAGPAHPPGDPGRRQHARIWEESESGGDDSARRISRDVASNRADPRARRGACRSPREKRFRAIALQMTPFVQAGLESWTFPVPITFALVFAAFLYLRGWLHLRSGSVNIIPTWRAVSFLLGLLLICVALGSPLAAFDEELLIVHMVQHLLLMTISPLLILLGAPVMPFLHGLPQPFAQGVLAPLFRWPPMQRIGRVLSQP